MLFFIFIWNLMAIGCLVIGLGLLRWFYIEQFLRDSDRIIIGIWLGIISISLCLTVASFLVPLSLSTAISVVLGFTLLVTLSHRSWKILAPLRQWLQRSQLIWMFATQSIVAILCGRHLDWIDSAIYHLGIMKWLNEFGSVPGVALINERFGYTSAWFSFSAPLMSPVFGDYIGATTNGFIFSIALISTWLFIREVFNKTPYFSDYFGCTFLGLTIGYYGLEFVRSKPSLISFSPDIAVTFLIGLTAWLILRNQECIDQTNQSIPEKNFTPVKALFPLKTLSIVFAAGALSYKLTALPVILISLGSYSIYQHRIRLSRILGGIVSLTILLIPIMGLSLITSGCPLYPSRSMCIDLPWTISTESSLNALRPILFLKGDTSFKGLPDLNSLVDFILPRLTVIWTRFDQQNLLLAAISLTLILIGLIFAFKYMNWPHWHSFVWVVSLAMVGSLFILLLSPLVRFGLGYFSLIPALFFANLLRQIGEYRFRVGAGISLESMSYSLMFIFGLIVTIMGARSETFSLVLPPQLPSEDLIPAQINDISYVYPVDDQPTCWAAELPCAMQVIQDDIRLRLPSQGIRGGFLRVEE